MNRRNKPKEFHRSNDSMVLPINLKVKRFYSFGTCRSDGLVEVGAQNLKGKELDHLIEWLQRSRKYQQFLKGKKV